MTWAPKNKGGEERKAEGGAEEALRCLNGDTKGAKSSAARPRGRCPSHPVRLRGVSAAAQWRSLRGGRSRVPCTRIPYKPQDLCLGVSVCQEFPIARTIFFSTLKCHL